MMHHYSHCRYSYEVTGPTGAYHTGKKIQEQLQADGNWNWNLKYKKQKKKKKKEEKKTTHKKCLKSFC